MVDETLLRKLDIEQAMVGETLLRKLDIEQLEPN